jgi:hypothetical protein
VVAPPSERGTLRAVHADVDKPKLVLHSQGELVAKRNCIALNRASEAAEQSDGRSIGGVFRVSSADFLSRSAGRKSEKGNRG